MSRNALQEPLCAVGTLIRAERKPEVYCLACKYAAHGDRGTETGTEREGDREQRRPVNMAGVSEHEAWLTSPQFRLMHERGGKEEGAPPHVSTSKLCRRKNSMCIVYTFFKV